MPTVRRLQGLAFLAAVLLLPSPCSALLTEQVFDELIDSPMYKSPDLPAVRIVAVFPKGAQELWLRALARPEADLKRQAAEAIILARQRGVKGLEATIAPLRAALDQPEQHPAVRLAAARALLTLEARETAPSLFAYAQAGSNDVRTLIEPALAQWDYRPARAVWLERLREPATPQPDLMLAIQGLGTVREPQAADPLRPFVLAASVPGPIRLEAARALARLRHAGLEKDAEQLAADASPRGLVARLAAASLLGQHDSPKAVELLQRLARDPEAAVAAIAVTRLLAIDSRLLVPALEDLLARPDPKLRSFAVEVLFRQPTAKHIGLLGERLDDEHRDVRLKARRSLHALAARKEFREPVIAAAARMLATQQGHGLEQATILLTQLDYKPAARRLLELLTFPRPEVYVTAAWGLRRLAVRETLPGVVRYLEADLKGPFPADFSIVFRDHQYAQLNQFLGQQKYAPADALLRQFIPKGTKPGPEARAGAVWALGLIHAGKPVAELVADLEERLNDVAALPPEEYRVRWMSAISIGRMKGTEALDSLHRYCKFPEPAGDPVSNACGWAIGQLTGEAMHPPKTIQRPQLDWFLVPQQ